MDAMISKFVDRLADFKEPDFEVSGVKFRITKLPPMKGFKLAEEIRVNLAQTANSISIGDGTEEAAAGLFFKAVLSLPVEFIEKMQKELFKFIEFTGGGTGVEKGWAKLEGSEDMAFQNFEIINIYEVLVRGLMINFSGSFSGMSSVFQAAAKSTPPPA